MLFVCKLNPVTEDDDLELIFSRFGNIKQCQIIRDYKTGDSLNYAFIEFDDVSSCTQAYFKMDGALVDDRRIKVDFSQSVAKLWNKARRKEAMPKYDEKEHSGGGGGWRRPWRRWWRVVAVAVVVAAVVAAARAAALAAAGRVPAFDNGSAKVDEALIEKLLSEREGYRKVRDYENGDKIKQQMYSMGVRVDDREKTWSRKAASTKPPREERRDESRRDESRRDESRRDERPPRDERRDESRRGDERRDESRRGDERRDEPFGGSGTIMSIAVSIEAARETVTAAVITARVSAIATGIGTAIETAESEIRDRDRDRDRDRKHRER